MIREDVDGDPGDGQVLYRDDYDDEKSKYRFPDSRIDSRLARGVRAESSTETRVKGRSEVGEVEASYVDRAT